MTHLKTRDLCDWLCISVRTAKYYRDRKSLPYIKSEFGNAPLYSIQDVKNWLKDHPELNICVDQTFEERWSRRDFLLKQDARRIGQYLR
jgi:hypothetical protein